MKLRKFIHQAVIGASIFTMGLTPLTSSSAFAVQKSDPNEVVSVQNFEDQQLDEATLIDMALKGKCVNNDITSVKVTENADKTIIVTVKKHLKSTKLKSGAIIDNYSATATGTRSLTDHDSSSTVTLTSGMNYTTKVFNGLTVYKITSYYNKPVINDTSFRLYSVNSSATQSAATAFTETGMPTMADDSAQFSVNYPVSGNTNSRSTGFVKYVLLSDAGGGGVNSTVKYQRNSTGTVYTFNLSPLPL